MPEGEDKTTKKSNGIFKLGINFLVLWCVNLEAKNTMRNQKNSIKELKIKKGPCPDLGPNVET
jgi:hypothetical protein